MDDLLRDTFAGQFLRFVSGRRVLVYPEEERARKGELVWKRTEMKNMEEFPRKHNDKSLTKDGELSNEVDEEAATNNNDNKEKNESEDLERKKKKNEIEHANLNDDYAVDESLVEWDDEDDYMNPRNWSSRKKTFVSFQICLLTLCIYMGSGLYSPGVTSLSKDFHVSKVASILGLVVYVLGYGLGPMLWSPLSEIPSIGRMPIYIFTLLVFVILQFPTALSSNLGTFLALRFLAAFFGSPALATGGATLGDMYPPKKRAYSIAIWGSAALCGPVLGPVLSGFAAQYEGWRWTIWELLWLSSSLLIFLILFLPETSPENILFRKARRLRRLTNNAALHSKGELSMTSLSALDITYKALLLPLRLNFTEPIVFFLNMHLALIFGLLYLWLEVYPIVFIGVYHFSIGLEGIAFLGILVGAVLALSAYSVYLYHIIEPKFESLIKHAEPEVRLPPAVLAAFCFPVCLFVFGWTARADIVWVVPIIASVFFGVGTVLMLTSVLNYLGDAYPSRAASAYAANKFMRSAFGGAFPVFATAMYDRECIGWATSTLGFISVAMLPIPYVLYKYGATLRLRSRMAG